MLDDMFEEDTVFFLFEDDYRFEDAWDTPLSAYDEYARAAEGHAGAVWAPQKVEKTAGNARVKGQWFETKTKDPNPNSLAEPAATRGGDLMHYMIQAHRRGCGDIVWMSWQPHGEVQDEKSGKDAEIVRVLAISSGALRNKGHEAFWQPWKGDNCMPI